MARILIIEDNPINLELMVYLLESHGHEISTARDGGRGVQLAREQLPDLIVCDVEMPGPDGYVVAAQLKSQPATSAIPLVAVTAHAMVGDRESALAVGFDAHFPKPINPPAFAVAIASMLAAGHPAAPAQRPSAPDDAAGDIPPDRRAPRPGITLLLVDDTPANLQCKTSLLEPAGYRVLAAGTVAEARQLLAAARVELVLCDVVMPGANGFDLIAWMRKDPRTQQLPLILLTASSYNNILRKQGLSMGARRFLTHPIDPLDLLGEIRAVLAEATATGAG
jgi:two-component system cell cycle response regulator